MEDSSAAAKAHVRSAFSGITTQYIGYFSFIGPLSYPLENPPHLKGVAMFRHD